MKSLTVDNLDHIAKLIASEVSYFNGWSVSHEQVDTDCFKAAVKIEKYLKGVDRRKNMNKS